MSATNIIPSSQQTCRWLSQKIGDTEKVRVRIPDLFVSFLADDPIVNPHYDRVKTESEAWISEFCSFDDKMSAAITKCDFSYFMAMLVPEARYEKYRTLCDWGNWVFPYDDMFDTGVLRDKPNAAAEVMRSLMEPIQGASISTELPQGRNPIFRVHDTVWKSIQETSPRGVQIRFAKSMADYCEGTLIQVEDTNESNLLRPEEMLSRRQLSAAVSPLFALVEYANELNIPNYVFEHPIIQNFVQIGIDLILLANDVLSYMKEEEELVPHNLIAVARMNGLGPQEAFDYVGQMLKSRHQKWKKAIENVPRWGDDVDNHVRTYIQGIANAAKANLKWSFKSHRYLGDKGELIKQTRWVEVLRSPPFLRGQFVA